MVDPVPPAPAASAQTLQTVQPAGGWPLAVAAGLGMALVAAVGWAALVAATGYEIGFAATLVGLGCAWAMHRVAKARSIPLFAAAAVLGLLGILAGKFLGSGFIILRDPDVAALGLSQAEFWRLHAQFFLEDLGDLLGPYDLLWAGLAVLAAWRILGTRREPAPAPAAPPPAQ